MVGLTLYVIIIMVKSWLNHGRFNTIFIIIIVSHCCFYIFSQLTWRFSSFQCASRLSLGILNHSLCQPFEPIHDPTIVARPNGLAFVAEIQRGLAKPKFLLSTVIWWHGASSSAVRSRNRFRRPSKFAWSKLQGLENRVD